MALAFENPAAVSTIAGEEPALQEGDDKDNLLVGTGIDDRLLGHGGNDILVGNRGEDYLEGGDGNDTLTSGYSDPDSGADHLPNIYAFDKNDGQDIITDLTPYCAVCFPIPGMPAPGDKIMLLGGTKADIQSIVDDVQKGGDGAIHYGDTVITILGGPGVQVNADLFVLG